MTCTCIPRPVTVMPYLSVRHVVLSMFCMTQAESPVLSKRRRHSRCGVCAGCVKKDCGDCSHCKDKKKFGGPGKKKQACSARKCTQIMKDTPVLIEVSTVTGKPHTSSSIAQDWTQPLALDGTHPMQWNALCVCFSV